MEAATRMSTDFVEQWPGQLRRGQPTHVDSSGLRIRGYVWVSDLYTCRVVTAGWRFWYLRLIYNPITWFFR